MSDEEQEAANRLRLWLRYGNPRPNPISDEGKQFENDLQLVTELATSAPPSETDAALVAAALQLADGGYMMPAAENMMRRLAARLQAAPPARKPT